MPYITINTYTTGKFKKTKINGRPVIITTMRPIRGDTAMNRIMYPDKQVQNSFMQFNNMLTPSGHPKVNGQSVSAFHPMAINSSHIGGSTQNTKKKGLLISYLILRLPTIPTMVKSYLSVSRMVKKLPYLPD